MEPLRNHLSLLEKRLLEGNVNHERVAKELFDLVGGASYILIDGFRVCAKYSPELRRMLLAQYSESFVSIVVKIYDLFQKCPTSQIEFMKLAEKASVGKRMKEARELIDFIRKTENSFDKSSS